MSTVPTTLISYLPDLQRTSAVTEIVVLAEKSRPGVEAAVRSAFPAAHVCVFDETSSTQDRIGALRLQPRPQLIVESAARTRQAKLEAFQSLFLFIDEGGHYVIDELQTARHPKWDDGKGETIVDVLADLARIRALPKEADRTSWSAGRLELAAAVGRVLFDGQAALVERRGHYFYKLREAETNAILQDRYGSTWGFVELAKESRTFESRGTVINHGDHAFGGRQSMAVPEMVLRHYHQPVCSGAQVVTYGDYVLPDSFRHQHARVLGNWNLRSATSFFARRRTEPADPPRTLDGSFYFLDSEHPRHFGHLTTEVLGRVWGWRLAKAADPSLRPLITGSGPGQIPGFLATMLTAYGIDPDDIEVIRNTESVRVEHLIGPTPQFENPYYIDPDMREIYAELARGLEIPDGPSPKRIFVSRPRSKRWCHQTAAIEQFFAEHDFHVFYPETLPYLDQAKLFAGAEVIAGFVGSGMFNMMLNAKARVIIIAGDEYAAFNEWLMASANGNEVHYFWGRSDVRMADGHSRHEASQSDFVFDLDRFRPDLKAAISA